MKGAPTKTQPGLMRAGGRKRHNRALREEALRAEALNRGISLEALKSERFAEVQELRRNPRQTPDWARPTGYREIVH